MNIHNKCTIILVLFVGLLLGSCDKQHPDWSDRERDERLLGKWYYIEDMREDKTPMYEFFPDGRVNYFYYPGSKGQYYTTTDNLYMYFQYGKSKSEARDEFTHYRVLNDTLFLWKYLNEPYVFVRTPN